MNPHFSNLLVINMMHDYMYYKGFHDGVCGNDKAAQEADYQDSYNRGYAIGVAHQPEGK
jgi:hypothetical protein